MAETGNARPVGTFEVLISYVTGNGGVYRPGSAAIELGNLNAALASGQAVIDGVTTGVTPPGAIPD